MSGRRKGLCRRPAPFVHLRDPACDSEEEPGFRRPQGAVGIAGLDEPALRRPQVVQFLLESAPPRHRRRDRADRWRPSPTAAGTIARALLLRLVVTATLAQPVLCVGANRFEEGVTSEVVLPAGAHQRLIDQTVQRLPHARDRPVQGQGGEHVGVPAANEHRQPFEETLVIRIEEVVRPLDHGGDGAVPFGPSPPHSQLFEPFGHFGRQLGDGAGAEARRGQFDGQRQPVEPPAQVVDLPPVATVQAEVGISGGGALHEQGDGRRESRFVVAFRDGQRFERDPVLAGDAEWFTARDQDIDSSGASAEWRRSVRLRLR